MNGLDVLITAIFIIAGCVISYYWGVSDGRKQMLAEHQDEVLAQGRRRDAVNSNGRKCSVCNEDLLWRDGRWLHADPHNVARGRHAPVALPPDA